MKNTLSLIFLLCYSLVITAQDGRKLYEIAENIPNETVYVHINTSLPFVGEYLYFKIYCLQAATNKPSSVSKIAYLELVNDKRETVYSQTVDLENGVGYGDYFLPTKISSGNYKLLAYTSWMRNNARIKYFEQDIFIINPYTSAQANIRRDSINYKKIPSDFEDTSGKVLLDKNYFKNREKVNVKFPELKEGIYSVSVRQKDSLPHPEIADANNVDTSVKYSGEENYFIPDLRGKLLKGKLTSNSGSNPGNVKVAFTVPGKDYFLRISNTDENGNFYFSIDENFVNEKALVQVLDNGTTDYEITMEEPAGPEVNNLKFKEFGIDSLARQMIVDRSIQNQIENAYFSLKPDTVKVNRPENLFEGIDQIIYDLDDYTRFETLRETFTEVIPYARVRKVNGKFEFGVLGLPPYENFLGDPLVIVDGVPLRDADGFIYGYEASKIDKIKIIRNKYYLGGAVFKGVIIIETINSNFTEDYTRDYLKEIELTSGNMRKNYFQQNYELDTQENIPDYRSQLLWLPMLEKNSFQFYTSDVDGIFEISVQGFTDEGDPVSLKRSFLVK